MGETNDANGAVKRAGELAAGTGGIKSALDQTDEALCESPRVHRTLGGSGCRWLNTTHTSSLALTERIAFTCNRHTYSSSKAGMHKQQPHKRARRRWQRENFVTIRGQRKWCRGTTPMTLVRAQRKQTQVHWQPKTPGRAVQQPQAQEQWRLKPHVPPRATPSVLQAAWLRGARPPAAEQPAQPRETPRAAPAAIMAVKQPAFPWHGPQARRMPNSTSADAPTAPATG